MPEKRDAVDDIHSDVRRLYPRLDLHGLLITGRVLRLALLLQARRDEQLTAFGITGADFDVLASLRRRAGLSAVNVRDLQRAMMLSSSGITKRLDRLESSGLVQRTPDPNDRRGVLISLTKTGAEVIDAAIPEILKAETALVDGAITVEKHRNQVEAGLHQLLHAQEPR
jgi:DNA-binding MarR family transcriptional regulator